MSSPSGTTPAMPACACARWDGTTQTTRGECALTPKPWRRGAFIPSFQLGWRLAGMLRSARHELCREPFPAIQPEPPLTQLRAVPRPCRCPHGAEISAAPLLLGGTAAAMSSTGATKEGRAVLLSAIARCARSCAPNSPGGAERAVGGRGGDGGRSPAGVQSAPGARGDGERGRAGKRGWGTPRGAAILRGPALRGALLFSAGPATASLCDNTTRGAAGGAGGPGPLRARTRTSEG